MLLETCYAASYSCSWYNEIEYETYTEVSRISIQNSQNMRMTGELSHGTIGLNTCRLTRDKEYMSDGILSNTRRRSVT